MKKIKLLVGIVVFFAGGVHAQNILIKPLSCPPSTACNPFLSGVFCNTPVLIKTSHGSPNYHIVSATNRQFKFEARIGDNGSQRTEGILLSYTFQPNKSYTVKIKHSGGPVNPGGIFPNMIAALTNFPQYMDDGCDQGNLISATVYQSWNFIISQAILTSQFTVTPNQPVGYLWLISSPVSNALGSFLIHSIQIIDNSLPPPPEECEDGDFDWFCNANPGGPLWQGNYTFRYTGSTYLDCYLFRDVANTPFVRRYFVSKAIYLNPGVIAGGDRGTAKLIAAADPCTAPTSGRGETIPPDILLFDKIKLPVNNVLVKSQALIKDPDKKIVEIYPNPASSELNIYSKERLKEIRIFDMNGKAYVLEYKTKSEGLINIDIAELTPGVYLAIIITENGIINNKFIVLK
ncbi:MAG: T9SS type A sorting domain-containing protein [Chitinophagaceae bacterium]